MLQKSDLLNLMSQPPVSLKTISAFDLLMFGLGSFVIIVYLLIYYDGIKKDVNVTRNSNLNNPIYQPKDILLQESNFQGNDFPIERTTSVWTKLLVYGLVIIVTITPLFELFGIEYFI